MPRKRALKTLSSDSSAEDEPLSKLAQKPKEKKTNATNDDDSSSESDIENYLQRADKIDLNSPFFNIQKEDNPPSFDMIEKDILAGVSRLTDSESEEDNKAKDKEIETFTQAPSTSKLNFGQLHEYTKKLEEAKRHVEEYNRRKRAKEKDTDIGNLLALGEAKLPDQKLSLEENLNSSDFESCSDSEREGWEEVEDQKEKTLVPTQNLEITVDMPGGIKKKKEIDVLAAIKRRINKVKKENQILVHKVHLLCWLAHGRYVSAKINSQNILAVALSLLPSEKCYPASRTDLSYLEQVLKWFRNAVVNVEKEVPTDKSLEELLEAQIMRKEAYDKKMLVSIFVAIMRSLGIHCRLVLAFQVEPLRPPNSELLSLSTKAGPSEMKSEENRKKNGKAKSLNEGEEKKSSEKEDKKLSLQSISEKSEGRASNVKSVDTKVNSKENLEVKKAVKMSRAKSTSEDVKSQKRGAAGDVLKPKCSTRAKSTSELLSKKEQSKEPSTVGTKKKPPAIKIQLKEPKTTKETKPKASAARSLRTQKKSPIPQLDGANDDTSTPPKPNLKKLKQKRPSCPTNPKGLRNITATPPKPNLKKLKQKQPPCPIRNHPKRLKNITKYRDSDSEDDFATTRSPFSNKSNDSPRTNGANLRKLKSRTVDVRSDVVDLVKKSIKSKTLRKRKSGQSSDDSDCAPVAIKKKHRESDDEFVPKVKVKKRVQVRADAEEELVKKKRGVDVWAEVFLETEEKWISVDVVKGQVHCVNELYTRASHPLSYIVAFNNDNTVKDITRRYCPHFNTITRKLRVDAKWWEQTVRPFAGAKTPRDREEDDELERQHLEKPLPTSIGEYKNHPLYVLKRHLLKFEALYPPDPPTLGFVRTEPVYSRLCVYTLHSRDIWLKHARVVKPGQQPYKIVKARPRWDKLSNSIITGEMLEIFGIWQTQDYEPPTAENGVVPRNAFGNVELFKACMLPKKTVHLKLPGLNKVAKKLNMDCAPALVGFDFHGGWNHPTYDGFIVCEENADILVAAWDVEQDEMEKRQQEKIDKRVYGNWRRLIRGLLIRERLKAKYEFGEPSGGGTKKKTMPKFSTKKRRMESGSD